MPKITKVTIVEKGLTVEMVPAEGETITPDNLESVVRPVTQKIVNLADWQDLDREKLKPHPPK